MERKDFLKTAGALGLGTVLPVGFNFAKAKVAEANNVCTLIPSETAGPFPLNLSGNATMFRQDIREAQDGVDHRFKMKIFGINNCVPMLNARVDVWHCNAYGYYSGYTTNGQMGTQNHVGETWLRGIQLTDANGEVEFLTKYPGWYSGRITHIHFQVFLSSVLQATSQFTYPVAEKDALYTSNAPYSTYGPDPTTLNSDNVFSNGYSLQMATLAFNAGTGEYDSYFEVGINGSGTVGLQDLEPETGGQFKLMQNHPNPFHGETTIPYTLFFPATVTLEIYNLRGKKVHEISGGKCGTGNHSFIFNPGKAGLASENYLYQIVVTNEYGRHSQCKLMTAG